MIDQEASVRLRSLYVCVCMHVYVCVCEKVRVCVHVCACMCMWLMMHVACVRDVCERV
jgi:hypothetical protein